MTDKERLTQLLDDMGVGYQVDQIYYSDLPNIVIGTDDGPKNRGYSGFYCTFSFNDDGSLNFVGCWE